MSKIYSYSKQALKGLCRGVFSLPSRMASCPVNAWKVGILRRRNNLRVHFGCGNDRQADFINVDSRPTKAADVVMDLNRPRFAPQSVSFAFSNAFFEHLYRNRRSSHLRAVVTALQEDGACCYMGIPYFRNIAKLYLERGPGTAGPVFDLYNVYRYTHGDPENTPNWWLAQLHKSLFDEEELSALLQEAGFSSFVLFCYAYPGDFHEEPVNMGFYATRCPRPAGQIQNDCLAFLARFADKRIRMKSLEWLRAGQDRES